MYIEIYYKHYKLLQLNFSYIIGNILHLKKSYPIISKYLYHVYHIFTMK